MTEILLVKKENNFKRQQKILPLISLSFWRFGKLWILINFSLAFRFSPCKKKRKERKREKEKSIMRKLLISQRQPEMEKDKPKSSLL